MSYLYPPEDAFAGLARAPEGTRSSPRRQQQLPGRRDRAAATTPAPRPRIVHRESEPPVETLYVPIVLGTEEPSHPLTGLFIPIGYRPQPAVDLVLYLHGFKDPRTNIARYWRRTVYPNHDLREELVAARKNVILVAPTLGPHAQAGRLVQRGGLDWYLGRVRAALAEGPYRGVTPPLRHLILSCHSGGGWPMRQLAMSDAASASRIRECWGFDCLYNRGDETAWASWARSRPEAKLYIHYGSGNTAAKSELLRRQGVSNVFVEGSTKLAHDRVPKAHWRERLRAASFLDDI